MTSLATRTPLQSLTNNHNHTTMPEPRRGGRRSSTRIAEKEEPKTTNGAAGDAAASGAAGRGKRKLAEFDEEDDGFAFKRNKSKRAKAATSTARTNKNASTAADEEPQLVSDPAPSRPRSRKKSAEPGSTSPALLSPQQHLPSRRVNRKAGTQSTRDGEEAQQDDAGLSIPKTRKTKTNRRDRTPTKEQPTKIALPFADTPVIRRNKEMRKGSGGSNGSRRSSLGLRGRRASSLIESGTSNALPHAEVSSSEFYKHIESGLPEPRRMKQLLTWCGTRALGDKPQRDSLGGEGQGAAMAAREIQQQLLNDFSSRSELSDWFAREDASPSSKPLKPNPRNIANTARIKDLQAQMQRLKAERRSWESLLQPPAPTTKPYTQPPLNISSSLPPSDDSPQQSNHNPTPSSISARLATLLTPLEFRTDAFLDSVHLLASFRRNADAAGRAALRGCAAALDERDRLGVERESGSGSGSDKRDRKDGSAGGGGGGGADEKDEGGGKDGGGELGARDVLRALSRVVER